MMKQALVSPTEAVTCVTGWEQINNRYYPVVTTIGARVAEVAAAVFEVAQPLFWIPVADDVTAESFYYDNTTGQVKRIPDPAPRPEPEQPTVTGAQTL